MKSFLQTLGAILWDHTLLLVGWFMVLAGLIITPLPIPVGLIMVILGLSLLTWKSHFLRNWFRKLRSRYSEVSSKLKKVTPSLPRFLRQAVELTEPDRKD